MKKIELNYSVPIKINESLEDGKDIFSIEGVAITASITDNGHKFLAEELETAAGSLNGVPLLKDHNNSVDSIMGRVISAEFSEIDQAIRFKANIQDKQMREMIKDGRLNTVSIGANVSEIVEEDGVLTPRGITFKELSLVAVPADSDAIFTAQNFSMCLTEAYNTQSEISEKPDIVGETELNNKQKEMTKIKETEKIEVEEVEEVAVTETPEETFDLEKAFNEFSENFKAKQDAQAALLSEVLAKLEEADADEEPEVEKAEPVVEPEKEEAKEEAEEPKVEKEAEAEPEKEAEEEEEEEEDSVDERDYSIKQDYNSFTMVQEKY